MFRSGILMMIITMISRILGLVRAGIIAYYFGASAATDAFFSAFKISNFFRQLLGEGALGSSFIPLYNEKVLKDGEEKSKEFIFSILNLLFIFSTIITLLMVIFSDNIIGFIVGGFSGETKIIASKMLKIMAFYFIFISLSGMVCAILNNFKNFAIPASTSIFFNLAIIIISMIFSKNYGVDALAYGVVLGGILQLLVVLPSFFKIVKRYSFRIDFSDPYLKKIFLMICPMLVGIVARQVNTIVDQFFASYLKIGAVSALENATRLYLLPVGVFGVSISTIIFPTLSKGMATKNYKEVGEYLVKGLNILIFLIIPSTAVLVLFPQSIVRLTLSYGAFDEMAVKITSESLAYYSIGLYFYTGIYLLTRAFYSAKDTKNPVKYSIISIMINISLNYLLMNILQHKGLALSTAIASGVNFIMLFIIFRKKYVNFPLKKIYLFLIKTLITTVIATIGGYFVSHDIFKLITFSFLYIVFWIKPLYKYRLEAF